VLRCAVQATVLGMMELHEFPTFRQHVRDFLVQSNSFADQNNADLFTEEVAAQVGGWVGALRGLRRGVLRCCAMRRHEPGLLPLPGTC
jgi:hypothetical protein